MEERERRAEGFQRGREKREQRTVVFDEEVGKGVLSVEVHEVS